ncbi:MAG: hypothetical protein NT070_22835 [Cyanobacteria bacterium]|nr:hypothetical protein [Cyanobacteriota bacterium]
MVLQSIHGKSQTSLYKNPDRLGTWGIRHLGNNKPGDQRTASFQDLLWVQ